MAKNGKWTEAHDLFTASLKSHESAEAWINLARTHEKLGETELAKLADQEYRSMMEVDPGQNARRGGFGFHPLALNPKALLPN